LARGSQKPIGPTPRKLLEEAKNRSVLHPGRRAWEGLQTKECLTTEETIKITYRNTDWVEALNEPLIMSTTSMRSTGGDHLVEKKLVTRERRLVFERMDTTGEPSEGVIISKSRQPHL
jgi:hypothetical protein